MKCSSMNELLISYIFDDISPSDRTQIEKHIATCRKCKEELQNLLQTRSTCDYWQEQPVSKNLLHATFFKTKPDILIPEELAAYLRISVRDVLANLESIPHFRVGKTIRFRREIISKWIEEIEHTPFELKSESRNILQTSLNRIFDITLS